ncbi:MAG: diguanylate cyclase, partial [Bacteroidales bacterium]|nr:diguanylate cyclase [Bacteroidales bacterium]
KEPFRRYVNDGIKEASRNNTRLSLVLISIADFDKLEQKLPHENINSTLEDMEALLENSVRHSPYRATDAVFKLSSDVFVVLANCDKENTLRVKERLEQKLDGYLTGQNLGDKIKLFFGCATYPDDATTSEDLTKKARKLQPSVASSV